jgi:hypothetical protein
MDYEQFSVTHFFLSLDESSQKSIEEKNLRLEFEIAEKKINVLVKNYGTY